MFAGWLPEDIQEEKPNSFHISFFFNKVISFKKLFTYLAALGLGCVMWDLPLQHTHLLGVACRLGSV